jgi:carbon monoxide dehydrogenase subunit G
MLFDQTATIMATPEQVWTLVNDIPAVSRFMPGIEEFEPSGDNTYQGTIKVKVGQIVVRLQGRIVITEQDPDSFRCVINVKAAEPRLNSTVLAKTTLTLLPGSDGVTVLDVHTEASVLGKLGEFGQAVLRRKGDQMLQEFTRNLAREFAPTQVVAPERLRRREGLFARWVHWIQRLVGRGPK